MKAVILAGGIKTRFSEETELRPKPMIEIGGTLSPANRIVGVKHGLLQSVQPNRDERRIESHTRQRTTGVHIERFS
jgi:molybdopterin-guanine dinucleotide biosynthesis protein A